MLVSQVMQYNRIERGIDAHYMMWRRAGIKPCDQCVRAEGDPFGTEVPKRSAERRLLATH
jgi:hypothetical protein